MPGAQGHFSAFGGLPRFQNGQTRFSELSFGSSANGSSGQRSVNQGRGSRIPSSERSHRLVSSRETGCFNTCLSRYFFFHSKIRPSARTRSVAARDSRPQSERSCDEATQMRRDTDEESDAVTSILVPGPLPADNPRRRRQSGSAVRSSWRKTLSSSAIRRTGSGRQPKARRCLKGNSSPQLLLADSWKVKRFMHSPDRLSKARRVALTPLLQWQMLGSGAMKTLRPTLRFQRLILESPTGKVNRRDSSRYRRVSLGLSWANQNIAMSGCQIGWV